MTAPFPRHCILAAALGAAAVLTPGIASAQGAEAGSIARDSRAHEDRGSVAASLAPSAASAALLRPVAPRTTPVVEAPRRPVPAPQARNRRGVPWMVAGGGVFLAGAIVGDDGGTVLMLGGIGLGTYGAFVYFGGAR